MATDRVNFVEINSPTVPCAENRLKNGLFYFSKTSRANNDVTLEGGCSNFFLERIVGGFLGLLMVVRFLTNSCVMSILNEYHAQLELSANINQGLSKRSRYTD